MATYTIYMTPGDDIELELQREITEICKTGVNKQVKKADLEDNQKRWLLIGICLQSIVSPTLRNFTESVVLSLYNAMKLSLKIHTQTYPYQQKKIPKSRVQLNYGAVNNNNSIRIGQKPDLVNYDYKVVNHVEFSKLFMQTYMAQDSAFDETCDLSALLTLIVSIDTFPQPVKNVALKRSFQLMHQLIKCLNMNTPDETNVLAELTKWETNGFMFLQGYAIDQIVVNELKEQTHVLAEYALKRKSGQDLEFIKIYDAMLKINGEMVSVCKRIDAIKISHNEQQTAIKEMNKDVNIIYARALAIENIQTEYREHVDGAVIDIREITQDVENLKTESTSTINRMESLAGEVTSTTEGVSNIRNVITEMKEDIAVFKNYMSPSKPVGKIFFYPPNRSEYFVARENEINQIKSIFVDKGNEHHTLVISGLGGCGKTILAAEFSWRSQEFYQGGVFWMSAESESSLEDSVTTLAIDVDTIGKDFRETFKRTLKWFSNLKERWLLVVDNADEEYLSNFTKELLDGSWKRNSRGHIIITTRQETNEIEESMLVKPENIICLTIFETKEGLQFVKRRTGRNDNKEDSAVLSLVEELGGLPLALEQASAHIKSIKCSFADYVKRFEKKRIKLLKVAISPRKISKNRLAIATTWQMNIDYISRQSENEGLGTAAITVMEIASFFLPTISLKNL
ncbi:unnamed protein product [Mytilus coruscus]|uniref:NB-ARC domain-containing protein n=1 Tax=Mytilus coruscus TaxID=42192 RepID=A0A6J8E949_MYTCO|nr:unnamed protein product [Mytilus coruscus]